MRILPKIGEPIRCLPEIDRGGGPDLGVHDALQGLFVAVVGIVSFRRWMRIVRRNVAAVDTAAGSFVPWSSG